MSKKQTIHYRNRLTKPGELGVGGLVTSEKEGQGFGQVVQRFPGSGALLRFPTSGLHQ